MKALILFVICSTFAFVSQAKEAKYDLTGRWGVGLGLGGSTVSGPNAFTEGLGELDGGFVGGLWVRYHYNPRLGVELSYNRFAFDFASTNPSLNELNPNINLLQMSAAYRAWPEEQFHLLVQLGLGLVKGSDFTVLGDNSFTKTGINARLGAEYMATPDLMMALHLDYFNMGMGDGPANKLNILAPMIALTYYFGGQASVSEVLVDSDNDGVDDKLDKCPNTLLNSNVSSDGCPLKNLKNDSDGDGVLDADDKCPGTQAGGKVSAFGCSQADKLEVTLNVQFATGSSKLDNKATTDLDKFGDFMMKYVDTRAEIEGHTDNTGSEKLNYTISQKRADSVRQYLLKKFKIKKVRLTSKGYGPSQPIGDNSKEEGRLKNRRVIAHVSTEAVAK